MPIFKWNGIDLNGRIYRGFDFAISELELQNLLLKREIGLMRCAKSRKNVVAKNVNLFDQLKFFTDILILLESGVLLPQALQIFVKQSENVSLRCVANYTLYQVQNQGVGFGDAIANFKSTFGNLVVATVQAGFYAGNLEQSLKDVCSYLKNKLDMQKELRKSILMPILTLVLFLVVALLIFIVIVPQFANIFANSNVPLEKSTQIVFWLSEFLQSKSALFLLLWAWLGALIFYIVLKSRLIKRALDTFVLYVPFINHLVCYKNLYSFLQSSSLLVLSGVPLVDALSKSVATINNLVLKDYTNSVVDLVAKGVQLSEAMQDVSIFFPNSLIAMISVGEESGSVGNMLLRGAKIYESKFRSAVQTVLVLVQPTLIICLGILVALLIFAIYIPIFNLPATLN